MLNIAGIYKTNVTYWLLMNHCLDATMTQTFGNRIRLRYKSPAPAYMEVYRAWADRGTLDYSSWLDGSLLRLRTQYGWQVWKGGGYEKT